MNIRSLAIICTAIGIAVAPAAAQSPAPTMSPLPHKVHLKYSCHGLSVPVTYDNVKDIAHVQYGSRKYALHRAPSADGARYMNTQIEWWEKGGTATLSSVTNGEADTVLATCDAIVKK
jgi:membrane-bound inhibitor of C-type lysozyme